MKPEFQKTVLTNGVRVLSERREDSRALSIGVWVMTGTRDESESEEGLSHFLEHLVFKGTKKRNAFQISEALESLGGELNAYTTKEYTNYHCTVLKQDWKIGLEVLCDLVCNMKLTQKDFKLEKGVILQEIAMSEDQYEEIIYDHLFSGIYGNHELAKPILGTIKSIAEITQGEVNEYYKRTYTGPNILVTVAGDVPHQEFVDEVNKFLKTIAKKKVKNNRTKPHFRKYRAAIEKDIEQAQLLVAFEAPSFKDDARFEAFIANTLLGGGMTSWLYQSVREKKGLAYSVYSALNTQVDSGFISVYAGCEPEKAKQVFGLILKDIKKLATKGVTKKQVESFKKQVIGGLLLSSDDIDNRMSSLGVNEMVFEKYRPIDVVIGEIERVSEQSVNAWIKNKLNMDQLAIQYYGPGADKIREWIKKI